MYIISADANGCTALTSTLPVTPKDNNDYTAVTANQLNDTTWLNPLCYIDCLDGTAGNRLLKFHSLATVADTKTVTLEIAGSYEI
jgi:hypothetical protein